jgi:hypothetical protein
MTKFDTPYFWCSTCERWNLTHVTVAHRRDKSRHSAAPGPAPAPGPAATPPEAAAMVAPMVSDFSLIQFGGFVCTPATDHAWYDADDDSIPLND